MTEDPQKRLILALAKARSLEPTLPLCQLLSMVLKTSNNQKISATSDEDLLRALETFLTKKYQISHRKRKKAE